MISKKTFTREHIQSIQSITKRDPGLIERVIFAFGLLEAIARAELPFIFKGGTSLMLISDKPRRFSTDIDILVGSGVNLEEYLEKAAEFWPFIRVEEQERKKRTGIEKRHFKFIYNSPMRETEFFILLDVVFEENPYATLIEREIANDLLIMEEPKFKVHMPNANCLLGDKLTAFAPKTTGIPYHVDKELEIIKQLYDIANLVPLIDNFDEVKLTYQAVVASEIQYRGLEIEAKDVLRDTISTALCVAGKGIPKSEEYDLLAKGVRNIRNHVVSESFTPDTAMKCACITLCTAEAILFDKEFPQIKAPEYYAPQIILDPEFNKLNYIKKLDLGAYAYLIEALSLMR